MTTLLTGLQRYYRLDSNGTEEVSAQNGVPTGSVTYSAGKLGMAANFNHDTTRRIVAPGLDLVTDLTISLWVYPTAVGNFAGILTHQLGAGGVDTNYHVNWNGNGIGLYGTGNASPGSSVLSLNTWSHFLVTRTTTGAVKYYVNGSLTLTSTTVGPHSVPTADLWIGNRPDLFDAFPGLVDEVAIYNSVVTPNAITALFGEGTPPDFSDFGDPLPEVQVLLPLDLFSRNLNGVSNELLSLDLFSHVRGQQKVGGDRFSSLYDKPSSGSSKFNPGFN
jgi:hypothetical protein